MCSRLPCGGGGGETEEGYSMNIKTAGQHDELAREVA